MDGVLKTLEPLQTFPVTNFASQRNRRPLSDSDLLKHNSGKQGEIKEAAVPAPASGAIQEVSQVIANNFLAFNEPFGLPALMMRETVIIPLKQVVGAYLSAQTPFSSGNHSCRA